FFAEDLPRSILVAGGQGIGKDSERYRAKAAEANEGLPLLPRGGPLLLLDCLQGADGGKDFSCLCFLAACKLGGGKTRRVEGLDGRGCWWDRGRWWFFRSWWLCFGDGGLSGKGVKQGPLVRS